MRFGTPCFEAFCDHYGIGKRKNSISFYLSAYEEVSFYDESLQEYSELWPESWNAAAKFYNEFK